MPKIEIAATYIHVNVIVLIQHDITNKIYPVCVSFPVYEYVYTDAFNTVFHIIRRNIYKSRSYNATRCTD